MTFPSSDLYDANLLAWTSFSTEGPVFLKKRKDVGMLSQAELRPTSSGVPTLRCMMGTGHVYLHSQVNPLKEAQEWFASLSLDRVNVLYVYGIGLGYYYDAAKEWLKGDSNRSLIFIEDEAVVLQFFLGTERCKELLADPQATFHFILNDGTENILFNDFALLHAEENHLYASLRCYSVLKETTTQQIKSQIDFLSTIGSKNFFETKVHGLIFFRNFFLNFLSITSSRFANALFGKFKDIPAIICGAGPSLGKNGRLLGELENKAIIFAGGTGMNAMNAQGVMPHFGVGIDPNPDQFTRLLMNEAFETPFLYRCRMLHEALEMVHGERVYVTGSGGYAISKWLEKKLGLDEEEFQEGFNVLTFSLMLAKKMGCNPLVSAGIDLAYSSDESYSPGIKSHPIHSLKGHFRTKGQEDQILKVKDIYGKPINTLWKWVAESFWYSTFPGRNPGVTLINCTEGGLGFHQVPNMPLEECMNTYLQKDYDLAGRLHGEIQLARLPASFQEERVREIMEGLAESLTRCTETCALLEGKLRAKAAKDEEDEELDEEIRELKGKLQQEDSYAAILKGFYDTIAHRNALRLRLHDLRVAENEGKKRTSVIASAEADLVQSIQMSSRLNEELIKGILSLQPLRGKARNIAVPSDASLLPMPSSEDVYVFNDSEYRIVDNKLGIHFSESAPESSVETLFYPSGQTKMETYYRDGMLHGPARFYDEEGNVLSESWFAEGRRLGRMRTYHLGGALHSERYYSQGAKVGVHRYFYEDGAPRSILPYAKGKLSGLVTLYHPGGILARRLTYHNGVREGLEEIWDQSGQLTIEARYAAGKPIGVAHAWHPNGVMSKEIIYDDNAQKIEEKNWNQAGELLEEAKSVDYFDLVEKESAHLTTALGFVVEKMQGIVPYMADRAKQSGMKAEMDNLKKEMMRLEKLGHALEKLHGKERESVKESLWKSPEMREKIDRELKRLSDAASLEMPKIEQGIQEIIQKLRQEGG